MEHNEGAHTMPLPAVMYVSLVNQDMPDVMRQYVDVSLEPSRLLPQCYLMVTSKNRFEKGKWVECAECDKSRRSKAVCLTRRFEEAGGVLYTFSLKQGF
jgi:hypothetical protein